MRRLAAILAVLAFGAVCYALGLHSVYTSEPAWRDALEVESV